MCLCLLKTSTEVERLEPVAGTQLHASTEMGVLNFTTVCMDNHGHIVTVSVQAFVCEEKYRHIAFNMVA